MAKPKLPLEAQPKALHLQYGAFYGVPRGVPVVRCSASERPNRAALG